MRPILLSLCLLLGCRSGKELLTAPPRPAPASAPTEATGTLTVRVAPGKTRLPEEVETLSLALVRLEMHRTDSLRSRWPLGGRRLSFPGEEVTLLETTLPAGTYDSLYLRIDHPRLTFGPNVGGPLTVTTPEAALPLPPLTLEPDAHAVLVLRLEPQASLWRDAACRWHFTPFWTVETGPQTQTRPGTPAPPPPRQGFR